MEQSGQNIKIAKNLLLIYLGQVLVVLCSLAMNLIAADAARTMATVAVSVGFRLVELWAAVHLYKVNRAYHTAMCAVALDILCWLLALLGLSVYNFVPMLSVVCEIAAVFYFCRGTDQVRGHTTAAAVIPVAYLALAAVTFVTTYLLSVSQGVYNAVQVVSALVCLVYALYLRQSAQVIAKMPD